MRRFFLATLCGALLTTTGCLFSGTQSYACNDTDTRCPDGQTCDIDSGRCVAEGTLDGSGTDGGATDGGCSGTAPACARQEGVCAASVQRCEAGAFVSCEDADYGSDYQVTEDQCDGLDNDCDGVTDLGCPECQGNETRVCGSDVGVCVYGVQQCSGNVWGPCSGVEPSFELCNDADDDCDGDTDEDLAPAGCPLSLGVCAGAQVGCVNGVVPTCDDVVYGADFEVSETRCDGLDNDCNGTTDQDFNGVPLTALCPIQQGVCDGATTTCGGALGFIACGATNYGQRAALLGTTYDSVSDGSCDGFDNNCNGQTDEDFVGSRSSCVGQGLLGVCAGLLSTCDSGSETCATPGGYEAVEVSCDGLDNDCDGATDDADTDLSCSCAVGSTQPCSSDVGVCVSGNQACAAGMWGTCSGVLPGTDTCNGLDDDCDGSTDEDFPTKGQSCTVGIGACERTGQRVCSADGSKTECNVVAGTAGTELCNGLDDDCDGGTDEDFPDKGTSCNVGVGYCRSGGNKICSADGSTTQCDAVAGTAITEVCDGVDQNCNTDVDDVDPLDGALCASQLGVCAGARETCQGGGWAACSVAELSAAATLNGSNYEAFEISCDGYDNDCDGQTDEPDNLTAPDCNNQNGVCQNQTKSCVAGGWQNCTFSGVPGYEVVETLCDGLDNDCNNQVDEGCGCVDGQTQTCGLIPAQGQCTNDTQTCDANGNWSPCNAVMPTAERCDALDWNCDGNNTDGFVVGVSCASGVGECAVGGLTVCNAAGDGVDCSATANPPSTEVCDGLDNNCDGTTDIDPATGTPLIASCPKQNGVCHGTTQTCSGGGWPDCTYGGISYESVEVSCDNKDNDCDGTVDVDASGNPLLQPCGNQNGVCQGSSQRCSAGTWISCDYFAHASSSGNVYQGAETICDGTDNDCNGTADRDPLTGQLLTQSCGSSSVGSCTLDTQVCDGGGNWSICNAVFPVAERCDANDWDCDGNNLNGFLVGAACSSGVGECSVNGSNICNPGGDGVVCDATAGVPSTEICDGLDNDCDGNQDNNPGTNNPLTQSCPTQVGVCSGTNRSCVTAGTWSNCDSPLFEPVEISCDGQDNDCNGIVDGPATDASCTAGNICQVGSCDPGGTGCLYDPVPGNPSCGVGCVCLNGALRENSCEDLADNDGDGLVDCDDPDCVVNLVCQVRCGDARCVTQTECNVCEECGNNPGCSLNTCGDGYCDLFGGECGVCTTDCTISSGCGLIVCSATTCHPELGECTAGCAGCASDPACQPSSSCNDGVCNVVSFECGTNVCDGFGEDCQFGQPQVCQTPPCQDGRCAPETGECNGCNASGEDCYQSPLCTQGNPICNDGVCGVSQGECLYCWLSAGQDCVGSSTARVPACSAATETLCATTIGEDSDEDGLVGCRDPDCDGVACRVGCTCTNSYCVDPGGLFCP